MTNKTPLKTRLIEDDYLDDETLEYVKYSVTQEQEIQIYLGPFGKWFTPCKEDQERLNYILENADVLDALRSTEPIKLRRQFVSIAKTEKETARRPPTKEDFKKYFSLTHWEEAWDNYLESLK